MSLDTIFITAVKETAKLFTDPTKIGDAVETVMNTSKAIK